MSSGDEHSDNTLKGGHAPADKIAGGVRIARKTRVLSEPEKNREKQSNDGAHETNDELVEESRNVLAHSGLAAQTNKDYPTAAIRAYHEKPVPQHQKPTQKPNTVLFQPSKQ